MLKVFYLDMIKAKIATITKTPEKKMEEIATQKSIRRG